MRILNHPKTRGWYFTLNKTINKVYLMIGIKNYGLRFLFLRNPISEYQLLGKFRTTFCPNFFYTFPTFCFFFQFSFTEFKNVDESVLMKVTKIFQFNFSVKKSIVNADVKICKHYHFCFLHLHNTVFENQFFWKFAIIFYVIPTIK